MKNFVRVSSLAFLLAASLTLPALAGTEEDAAAPAGSFTSDMSLPHLQFAGHHGRDFFRHHRLAMRMQHRVVE